MRLKHVKGANEIIENSSYVVLDYKDKKGFWNNLFDNNNPIHIEIGMGKGNFLIGMAEKYPNINFIGIEKFDSVLVRAVQKMSEINLNNLKFIRMDATEIGEVFDKEIDTIYLNFSDPWPKKRHAHRRLTSPIFLNKYENIFKNNFHIVQKTDNRNLFEYSVASFNNNGYKINDICLDLYDSNYPDNVPTEYEQKFNNLGKPIYMIDVIK